MPMGTDAVDPGLAAARQSSRTVQVTPLSGLPLFKHGDDLAAAIASAMQDQSFTPAAGDVIVVAQKIVSKAEGRAVRLDDVKLSDAARQLAETTGKHPALAELILRESQVVMRAKAGLVITRHRLGHVAAHAGIDASNIDSADGEAVLLWPLDPDASARHLRSQFEARFGVPVAVIISDSLGRAWRMGTVGTAIGASGLNSLTDRRGETDLFGRVLQATLVARADELAAAASLVIGEAAEATPVAIIRGASYIRSESEGIAATLRPIKEDLFT
jgi:coenzyme F420-0:L-glutamate ligase/coenzyme F420-1:gamma-L-glutamate ligase